MSVNRRDFLKGSVARYSDLRERLLKEGQRLDVDLDRWPEYPSDWIQKADI